MSGFLGFSKQTTHTMWAEELRPKSLSEFEEKKENQERQQPSVWFRHLINMNEATHLLIWGPPGTGKTSAVLAFLADYYNRSPDDFAQHVRLSNASDKRRQSIEYVRQVIRDQTTYSTTDTKLFVFDEADELTVPAQRALCAIMDESSKHTRFWFICNDIDRITSQLQSRSDKIAFLPLNDTQISQMLINTAKEHHIDFESPEISKQLAIHARGDARVAIHTLQLASVFAQSMFIPNINAEALELAMHGGRNIETDFVITTPDSSCYLLDLAPTSWEKAHRIQKLGIDAVQVLNSILNSIVYKLHGHHLNFEMVLSMQQLAECIAKSKQAILDGCRPTLHLVEVFNQVHQFLKR